MYIDELQRESELSTPAQADALRHALEVRLARGEGPFTVDFSGIHSVGKDACQVLVRAAKTAHDQGRTLELSHPPRQLLRMIQDSGQAERFGLTAESLAELQDEAGIPAGVRGGLPIIVPANLGAIQVIRDVVVQLAREMGFCETAIADIELSVGEAAVNAVRYGSPNGTNDRLMVRFFEEADGLVVEIRDSGTGFDPEQVPQPSAPQLRENGLGIFLMRNLMDRVVFTQEGGLTVRLEKSLPNLEDSVEYMGSPESEFQPNGSPGGAVH
ncbi:MAG: ATP-binding protein [Armatimonadetes bacterium]|nr:ATP-binding protein [Armatimonadota bacterium]